jgi:hypothetical protein
MWQAKIQDNEDDFLAAVGPNECAINPAFERNRRIAANRAFHAAGTARHGKAWNAQRSLLVRVFTHGRTDSSRDLSADELVALMTLLNGSADSAQSARDAQAPADRPLAFAADGALPFSKPRW